MLLLGGIGFGLKGRAHYAAANQFLTALAHYRRSLQLPALTINWGNWGTFEGSAYSSAGGERLLEDVGLPAMEPEDALDAMAYLTQHGAVQKMVAAVDWAVSGSRCMNRGPKGIWFTRLRWRPWRRFRRRLHFPAGGYAVPGGTARTGPEGSCVILAFDHRQPLDRNRGLFEMGMDSLSSAQLKKAA